MRLWTALVLLTVAGGVQSVAWGQAYCNITELKIEELSNGVQISLVSDGRLEWDSRGRTKNGTELKYAFDNARLELEETFINVDKMPVSYVQFDILPAAKQGIGVMMTVTLMERAQVRQSISPDLQTFILTAMTRRTVSDGDKNRQKTKPEKLGEGSVAVEADRGLLTVRAVAADIHEVVAKIAREGGVNVAVNDHVKHKVSLNVLNAPPLVLLKGIAAGYGLALSRVGDVEMISEGVLKEKDLATYNRSATASFPITYLQADEAAGLLPNFLISYLHVNAEQNAVVVTAPSQMLSKIESDLKAIDVPPPVIMVDAMVVEVSATGELYRNLGMTYFSEHHDAHLSVEDGDLGYGSIEPLQIIDGLIPTAQLTVTLEALLSKGSARIRAKPRMAAVNGKRAEIFIGAQRFIRVTYLQYGQEQERIQGVPVGVKLVVNPWTGGDDEITSGITVEVSNIRSVDPETGLPLLSTRRANTTVRTRAGETIVIGGLRQQQTEVTRSKIPILGDIPLIGNLFRSKSSSTVDTELFIFVTPRVLDTRGRQSEEAERKVRSQFLREGDPGWMPPKDDQGETREGPGE